MSVAGVSVAGMSMAGGSRSMSMACVCSVVTVASWSVASVSVANSPMDVVARLALAGGAWAPFALTGLGVTHPAESTTTHATRRSASFANAPVTSRNSDNRAAFGHLRSHAEAPGRGKGAIQGRSCAPPVRLQPAFPLFPEGDALARPMQSQPSRSFLGWGRVWAQRIASRDAPRRFRSAALEIQPRPSGVASPMYQSLLANNVHSPHSNRRKSAVLVYSAA